MTPAEIKTRIDRLQRARDSGVLNIKHGETSTSYRSLAEMEAVLASLKADLARAEGAPRRRRSFYVNYGGKGL